MTNTNTILLTESGDLEVYEGDKPEKRTADNFANWDEVTECEIENEHRLSYWLSTKKVVKMSERELERLVDHLDLWNKEIESPIDVSDFVTEKDGLYHFSPPVDKEEETQENDRMKVIKECQEELLKHLFPVTHLNGYPVEAVPKATILELDKLLKFKRR